VGGVGGLLVGLALLAIPGVGPVVAAGWLVARPPVQCQGRSWVVRLAASKLPTRQECTLLRVCLGKVKSEARPYQLITFTRCLHEALPIEYRDLPSAARDQTGAFQLPGGV
jgi:hypothetical protein